MSQKKAKLLNKFLKTTGQNNTGTQWQVNRGMDSKGRVVSTTHTLRDDKRIKKAYKDASYKQKTSLSEVMLSVNKKK